MKFIYLLLFFLVSCNGNIERQKEEAQKVMNEYVDRANAFNEEFKYDQQPLRPRRDLLQFTYGPESLNNNNFLNYLVLSNAKLSNDLVVALKEKEAVFKNENVSNDFVKISNEIKHYKKIAAIYKKFSKSKTLSLYESNLQKTLRTLIKFTGIKVNAENININGQYKGSVYEIINSIADDNNLVVYFSEDYKTIFLKNQFPTEVKFNKIDWRFGDDPQKVGADLQIILDVVSQLDGTETSMNEVISNDNIVKTQYGQDIVKRLIDIGETTKNIRELKALGSSYRQELIARSEKLQQGEVTESIAIFNETLINGQEKVIEKFAVYNDTPDAMFTKLQAFTIFNQCSVTELSDDDEGNLEAEVIADLSETMEEGQTNNPQNLLSANDNPIQTNSAIEISANELTNESDSLQAEAALGCVDFIAEDYGIIASGSILDVKLVEKFLVDQDQPVKQVMIESFILEVNSDWKNEIESKISGSKGETDDSNGFYSFATGLLDIATATTEGGFVSDVRLGTRYNLNLLVNFIETNTLGRKISNPVILVKDGEQGVVDKTRTFRVQRSTSVANASTTTTTSNEIDEYEAPLKLTITPQINKHNDVIDLDFDFVEERYDSTDPTSASTSNKITTKLTIKPGEVVMMAGLFQQSRSENTQGLPFLSKLLSPWGALLGGGELKQSDTGTELLVFINPTVITKENIDKTITRTRY